MQRWVMMLTMVILLSGCVSGDAHLKLHYDQKQATLGPLSSFSAQSFKLGLFKDHRPETYSVGYKGNTLVQTPDELKTQQSVSTIIQQTVATLVQNSGHNLDDEAHLELSGNIKVFWLDVKPDVLNAYFAGNVAIHLVIQDLNNELIIYEQDYAGHYHETSMVGLKRTWERVLNEALIHMAKQISLDQGLVDALQHHDISAPKIVPLNLSL